MSTSYGAQMALALRAVRQMHTDTSVLLQDCRQLFDPKAKVLGGSVATRSLTRHYNATQWMAEGVWRYFALSDPPNPGVVEGLTVAFIDKDNPTRPEEPLLIVGRISYRVTDKMGVEKAWKEWDLWHAYFTWATNRHLSQPISQQMPQHERVEAFTIMAVPLYNIGSIDDVKRLLAQIRL